MIRSLRLLRFIVVVSACCWDALLFAATGLSYDLPKGEKAVRVLYGERGDLPAIEALEENIRQVFHASTAPHIALFSEYLDFTRFPAQQYETSLIRYLRERYAGRRIDLVMPVAGSALEFALAHREELFPGAGLWETHRTCILTAAGTIIFLSGLIAVLLVERFWRRKAETSLRQSEERMRLMLEATPNGVLLVNEQGRVVLVNSRVETLFGYKYEELIGQPLEVLLPARFRDAQLSHGAQFFAAPVAMTMGTGRELFALRKDGSEFPVEIGISRVQSKEGILGLAVINDISTRKRAEAEARRYREELAHLSRVEILGELVASIAHELNQPLTGIMNNASAGRRFIAKGLADMPKLDGLLQYVVADARRAGQILHGIRCMVRKGEGERDSVNLNTIVAELVPIIRSDALERHCAVVTEPDPMLPMVKANRVQLQQVLLNIIMNAFDAMCQIPPAKRRVIIRTEAGPDGVVQVTVRDFGIGLPTQNPQRIFEQFFSTKRDGLGIGLAIARSIIVSHGGELGAENAEGGGTRVYFSLPIAEKSVA